MNDTAITRAVMGLIDPIYEAPNNITSASTLESDTLEMFGGASQRIVVIGAAVHDDARDDVLIEYDDLESVHDDLESVHDDLESVRDDLESVRDDLESAHNKLGALYDDLESVHDDIESVHDDLESVHDDLESAHDEDTVTGSAQLYEDLLTDDDSYDGGCDTKADDYENARIVSKMY